MPKQEKKQGGHRKTYGPKMAYPRIKRSKEHRQCGPLGYRSRVAHFTTRRACLDNL